MPELPVITLLSDFGTSDYFVGAVKGAILSRNSQVTLVDITHDVPPQDIESGAFTLFAAYRSFPPGTIHLAVVDPGVGSERRAIVVHAGGHLFVGPDNGLFTFIYESEDDARVFEIDKQKYLVDSGSSSFHGRDLFGPVAAILSTGVEPETVGPEISDPVRLRPLKPEVDGNGTVRGRILQIDRFGNCITNITKDLAPSEVTIKDRRITQFRTFFAEAKQEELFVIWGSAGFLEIAIQNGSAAEELGVAAGDDVLCVLSASLR
jgi:S-adenosylmethionine hydrolase